jgi:hypothetical protein
MQITQTQMESTMDAPVLTQWLADLRSGQFTQTNANLRDAKGYCCLGVLANQFADDWIGDPSCRMVPRRGGKHLSQSQGSDQSGFSGHLSYALMNEIGLDGVLASDGMTLNDLGVPFPKIADYIEQWLALQAAGENPGNTLRPDTYIRAFRQSGAEA